MKVLIATKETQGRRKNDFSFTNEGELVKFGLECDGEEVDGKCGCRRSMVGFDSKKATTTFKIEERNITKKAFIKLFKESEEKAGWKFEDKDMVDFAKELIEIPSKFEVGDILEKRGEKISIRK